MSLPDDIGLVEPERKADILIDRIAIATREHVRKRERAFTARDALIVLEFESLFVAVAAANLAHGVELTDEDRKRLLLAHSRVSAIVDEAIG